jgi:SAM-dependent methyltransferase
MDRERPPFRPVSLWQIHRFAYMLALRCVGACAFRTLAKLVLEPCTYWRNVEVPEVLSPKLPSLFIWQSLGAEVWSTDLFPYFLDEYSRYQKRLPKRPSDPQFHIELQDARGLTYPDSYFDKVYSISVLEHIADDGDSQAMREIGRVLKAGGLCCLTVPFASTYREETSSRDLYYKKHDEGKAIFYQRHYDEKALREHLIAPSGLDVCDLQLFGERWVPFERAYAKLPLPVKAAIAPLGPLLSLAFLHRIKKGSKRGAKAALLLLRKRRPAGGGPP